MLKDQYNIIVIPMNTARILRFKISGWSVKLALATTALFLVFTVYVGYRYSLVVSQKNEYYALMNRSHQLNFQFKSMVDELDNLNRELKEQQEFDKKIRIVTYQKNGLSDLDLEGSKFQTSFTAPLPGDRVSSFGKEIPAKIDRIKFDLSLRKTSFLQIVSSVHENKDKLARTPTIRPVRNGYLTSGYGIRNDPFTGSLKMHNGIDWAYYPYTPIYSPAEGTVERIVKSISYGNMLVINHGYDLKTRYAHLAKVEVKKGQKVKRGQMVARMGNTGIRSTGNHLHYEIMVKGKFVDPELYILEPLNPFDDF